MGKRNQKTREVTKLRTPEVQAIADELLETAKLATKRAIDQLEDPNQENFPARGDSLEEIILNRLKTLKPEVQKRAIVNSKVQGTTMVGGRMDKIDTTKSMSVFEQLRGLQSTAALSLDTLAVEGFDTAEIARKSSGQPNELDFDGAFKKEAGKSGLTLYRELELRVHKLECAMTTNGSGDDEISLTGTAIRANGSTKNLNIVIKDQKFHHADYDNDEVVRAKIFSPPKVFARFKFEENNTISIDGETYPVNWPKTYSVAFIMAELDNGDFPDFAKQAMNDIREAAVKEVAKAIKEGMAKIGSKALAVVGVVLAGIAGKIMDYVLEELFAFFIKLWENDRFSLRSRQLPLSIPAHKSGDATIERKPIVWTEHGGIYKLYFDWHFNDPYEVVIPMPGLRKIPAPGAVNWYPVAIGQPERTEIIARGLDRKMYKTNKYGNNWTKWSTFSDKNATFKSTPTATSWKKGQLELFALGDDDKIYQNSATGLQWSGWNKAHWKDFLFQYGLAATSRKPNYVDLFAVGMDGHIYNFYWNGQAWSGLRKDLQEKKFISAPAVVSRAADRLDVVVRGEDRKIYISSWKDSWGEWSDWSPIGGGTFTSPPTICSWDEERLHVFARGDDRKIYHSHHHTSSGWTGWTDEMDKTGTLLSGPTAISKGPGLIDLFAVGDDQNMHRNVFDGTKWSGWFNDFKPGKFK